MEPTVVAAGGLDDGASDAVPEQPVAQGAATALVIVEVALEAILEDVGVQPGLTDNNRSGFRRFCFPVLLRFGASPTFPFRSRSNGSDGPTKLRGGPTV